MTTDNRETGADCPHVGPIDADTFALDPTAGKTVAEIFGEIVWLMTQDPVYREMRLGELEALVMPPILFRQFHITYAPVPKGRTTEGGAVHADGDKGPGAALQPVRVEIFAMLPELKANALAAVPETARILSLQEWRSGTTRLTIRTVAPFGRPA